METIAVEAGEHLGIAAVDCFITYPLDTMTKNGQQVVLRVFDKVGTDGIGRVTIQNGHFILVHIAHPDVHHP